MPNRRDVLGALAGGVTLLAGCSGDTGAPEGSDPGSKKEPSATRTEGSGDTPTPAANTRTCVAPRVEPRLVMSGEMSGSPTRPLPFRAGTSTTVTLFVTADWPVDVLDATLDVPWPVSRTRGKTIGLESEYSPYAVFEWEITVPTSADGHYDMTVSAPWEWPYACAEGTMGFERTIRVSPTTPAPIGFDAGGRCRSDEWVRVDGLWFEGGTGEGTGTPYVSASGSASASPTDTAVDDARWDADIATVDRDHHDDDILAPLYRTAQFGGNLGYDVAIENGTYDVTLYFAENNEEIGPGDRRFDVSVQGTTRLEAFDVAAQNEFLHAPVVRTFEGIDVTDGTLSISTESIEGNSLVNGFGIRASDSGQEE